MQCKHSIHFALLCDLLLQFFCTFNSATQKVIYLHINVFIYNICILLQYYTNNINFVFETLPEVNSTSTSIGVLNNLKKNLLLYIFLFSLAIL